MAISFAPPVTTIAIPPRAILLATLGHVREKKIKQDGRTGGGADRPIIAPAREWINAGTYYRQCIDTLPDILFLNVGMRVSRWRLIVSSRFPRRVCRLSPCIYPERERERERLKYDHNSGLAIFATTIERRWSRDEGRMTAPTVR